MNIFFRVSRTPLAMPQCNTYHAYMHIILHIFLHVLHIGSMIYCAYSAYLLIFCLNTLHIMHIMHVGFILVIFYIFRILVFCVQTHLSVFRCLFPLLLAPPIQGPSCSLTTPTSITTVLAFVTRSSRNLKVS
jgi:hypothetical protein